MIPGGDSIRGGVCMVSVLTPLSWSDVDVTWDELCGDVVTKELRARSSSTASVVVLDVRLRLWGRCWPEWYFCLEIGNYKNMVRYMQG